MRRNTFALIGVIGLFIIQLWTHFWDIVDFVGHVIEVFGWAGDSYDPRQHLDAWLRLHPALLNDYLVYAAYMTFIALICWPVIGYILDRYLAGRDIDKSNGWSISITTTGNAFGIFSGDPADEMLAFQPFRFSNVSSERPRVLDVIIKSTYGTGRDKKKIQLYNSEYGQITKYQLAIQAWADSNRQTRCLTFPLRIEPSEVIEGQIIIPVTDQLREIRNSSERGMMRVTKNLRFVFRDHISGREIVLRGHAFFDANKGYAFPTRKPPSLIAQIKGKWRQRQADRLG